MHATDTHHPARTASTSVRGTTSAETRAALRARAPEHPVWQTAALPAAVPIGGPAAADPRTEDLAPQTGVPASRTSDLASRTSDLAPRTPDEDRQEGSLITEYGLLAIVAATVAAAVISWASDGAMATLFNALLRQARGVVGA